MLNLISQWTQVLSAKTSVTISLVRHCISCMDKEISSIQNKGTSLLPTRKTLGTNLVKCAESFRDQYNVYFNEKFRDFYLYKFGEFLDPRTHRLMSVPDMESTIELMKVYIYISAYIYISLLFFN